jgi:hypothetical protein
LVFDGASQQRAKGTGCSWRAIEDRKAYCACTAPSATPSILWKAIMATLLIIKHRYIVCKKLDKEA